MNKYLVLIIIFLGAFLPSTACDICGCFMGITPYDNQSGINVVYRYRSFNGYSNFGQSNQVFPSMAVNAAAVQKQSDVFSQTSSPFQTASFKGPVQLPQLLHGVDTGAGNVRIFSSADYEIYNVYEVRAKYFIHQRIEINGIMPVNNSRSLTGATAFNHTGLGDVTVFAGYHLLRKIEEEKFQHRLILGGGIKLPVGNYYAKANDERIPLLMQPGTGSVDYFSYFNYIIGYKKFGMNINAMYKLNGENYYKERIANSTADYMSLFYKIPLDNWILIPSVQFYYEYTGGLKINNVMQPGTSMNIGMLGPGFDVYYKNISLNTSFQYTVMERTHENNLGSAARIVVGLGYNLKQLNYLIKEKEDEN